MGSEKANVSEPLMTCRKLLDDIKTGAGAVSREQRGGSLLTARVVSGMKVARAQVAGLAWNVGTCRLDSNRRPVAQEWPAAGGSAGASRAAETVRG